MNKENTKSAIAVIATFAVITIVMVLLLPVEKKNKQYEEFGRLAELAETDERAEYIVENGEQYPEYILDLFYESEDNLEFVYNYPFCKDNYANMSYTDEELGGGVPALYMDDPRWAYERIGNYNRVIRTDGCAYLCVTMAYIGLTGDGSIDPVILGELSVSNSLTGKLSGGLLLEKIGELCDLIGLSGTYYNFDVNREGTQIESIEEISAHLDNNSVIIAGMQGDTFGSHAIVIRECDGSNLYINDPANPEKTAKAWNFDDIKSEFKGIWVITKA